MKIARYTHKYFSMVPLEKQPNLAEYTMIEKITVLEKIYFPVIHLEITPSTLP